MKYCFEYQRDYPKIGGLATKIHIRELNDLQNDSNILITKPANGTGVVILDNFDCTTQFNSIWSNENKFKLAHESISVCQAWVLNDYISLFHKKSKSCVSKVSWVSNTFVNFASSLCNWTIKGQSW